MQNNSNFFQGSILLAHFRNPVSFCVSGPGKQATFQKCWYNHCSFFGCGCCLIASPYYLPAKVLVFV